MKNNPKIKPILVVVLTGPSGVGQTTIASALLKKKKILGLIKGTTTRPRQKRRGGDQDHIFVTTKKFLTLKKDKLFLETDKNTGFYYGTAWSEIDRVVAAKKVPLLTLTVRGHAQLRKNRQIKVCSIFIAPENLTVLKKRILKRQSDMADKELLRRLKVAREVLERKKEYDFVVINREGQLNKAVKEVFDRVDSCLRLG